ncbi:MAG: transcription elongation factor GreA [Firmicutes bacterium]|jgi:transcription elongation factor GreA|nr:transcription elongation factor GreA [Bacillota bacterium]MEE3383269.1 transcription elongation factor GreA [Anaerovoracaceae bacterium]MBQ1715690.1 transcription elongation factor GreA [Bacillota bacterium]MBQ1825401.1 transcription elongation factor GreA [Bacillota bacterium]MBQ2305804.1 transcription elongation factor GreA [Bacillota bacterium]
MAEKQTFTQEGYDRIVAELDELITVKRPEIAEKLKEARAFGDLSENAEYDAALDEQAETEERIQKLEEMVKNAVIINEDEISNDFVGVGLNVKVKNLVTKQVSTYSIVGTTEVDPFAEPFPKISNESLIGQHLIGKKKGDEVEVIVPDGTLKLKIMGITK